MTELNEPFNKLKQFNNSDISLSNVNSDQKSMNQIEQLLCQVLNESALPILAFTSASDPSCSSMMIPRYVKDSTCSRVPPPNLIDCVGVYAIDGLGYLQSSNHLISCKLSILFHPSTQMSRSSQTSQPPPYFSK
ncbi:unnamed protein product [Schistosoma curassoni]|uniref:Putative_PNPOx domain-containing protein n=1 Tax=Schistosoma curassoni TaxID=6186 RepID=A0A183JWF3_9TREM|nr:unnamed protein product [Schistosoma curassoni]